MGADGQTGTSSSSTPRCRPRPAARRISLESKGFILERREGRTRVGATANLGSEGSWVLEGALDRAPRKFKGWF